ncbi:MAG TPA: hypothetical protein VGR26_11305 [Acidimicrobiales bacterium]|nr:hypothetical protein [Acidimicrobiales bacterium]
MAKLDREQIHQAIKKGIPGDFRIVDADDDDENKADEAAAPGVPAATLDAIRARYEQMTGPSAGAPPDIEKSSQFVVIEPDDELVTDFKAPNRRVRILSSESGEIVAEQG